jgi:hypothetical protein
VLGAVAFWFVGFETGNRSIAEIDAELSTQSAAAAERVAAR